MSLKTQNAGSSSYSAVFVTLIAILYPSFVEAQSAETIVKSLQQNAPTKSFAASPLISDEDRRVLDSLPTRSLHEDDLRAEIANIVKRDDLPKIDLTINFEYDSDLIAPESVPTVIELGKALIGPTLRSARILLNGHTDAAGNDRYNLALSERRAQSVKTYLVNHFGISNGRLFAVGYGREQLKNKAIPRAAENRRVEVVNLSAN